MIQTLSSLVESEVHHGEEVTVRCIISDGPKAGSRGGEKTLYDVDVSDTTYSGDAFLSIWHEDPVWTDNFGSTAEYIPDLLDDFLLQKSETVLARGVPNIHDGKWYFNVTSMLIREPDISIGKSEMRSANECPRIYNLAFEKNIYSPGRYDLSPGSIKGRIVHSVLEYALKEERYQDNFETGWSEADIEACLTDVIEDEYTIELALCRLAWVSTKRIKEHAEEAVTPLLSDEEFVRHITESEELSTEIALSSSLGFNGRVDLLIDGVPYDLKTAYDPTESQRQKNRFQLRIYLLALTLESLEPGQTFGDRLEDGIEGVLVYPNLADSDGVELERVDLREQDIKSISQLRNEAAVLREGFGVPTTYGRDCEGCRFKEPTKLGPGDSTEGDLPPPCQFYCQSERRWECFETNDQGEVITQCPLFDQCEQRLEFRDPEVTDHYNQLRSALNAEHKARKSIGNELEHLADDTLALAGLLLPELSLCSVEGQRRLYFESTNGTVPSFEPGDQVRLQHSNSEYYQEATYYGRDDGEYVFQLDAAPTPSFLDPTISFEARHTIAIGTYPRQLLSHLDYAQRAEVTPLLESKGEAGDALENLSVDDLDTVDTHVANKELYINVPIRPDRISTVATIVEELSTAQIPEPQSENQISRDDQRILVLSSSPAVTDTISDCLSGEQGFVRMDGFAGGDATTVTSTTDSHDVYAAIESSNIVLSSTRFALSENVFHAMRSGDSATRPHSDRFFDAVVIADAETLTEPQFHFLRVLGDRLFALGDTHRSSPEMVSGEAQNSRLGESYFNRLYRRFANVKSPESQSLVVSAVFTSQMAEMFASLDVPFSSVSGNLEFVDADGATTSALDHTTLEYRFSNDGEQEARFLRLQPVEEVDVTQVSRSFDNLRTLDAGEFTIQDTYMVQDIRFEVKTNNPLDEEEHHVKIQVPTRVTPILNRLLTHNPGEAASVVEVCAERSPDAVITPFAAHANTLREELEETGYDIPVYLPGELSGEQFETTVVSFGISDDRRIVLPPVSSVETLYTVLNSGTEVTIVGDKQTLERNSLLSSLL